LGNPDYQEWKIYNIHTDVRMNRCVLISGITSGSKYRDWAFRELFDGQTTILGHWDSLNSTRKIVGFAAVVPRGPNIRAIWMMAR
jgi:hypothetical protein